MSQLIVPATAGSSITRELVSANQAITADTVYGPYAEDRFVLLRVHNNGADPNPYEVRCNDANPPVTVVYEDPQGFYDSCSPAMFVVPAGHRWKLVLTGVGDPPVSIKATIWKA